MYRLPLGNMPNTSPSLPTATRPASQPAQAWDPQVVALSKAIRDAETGNKVTPGKTGELPSRYQWMPGTWTSAAKQYLGDANAPLTLQNENFVAYNRIKSWKDQGMNPMQIASMWNSGNPDPNAVGKGDNNGVAYDVPAYAQKVYGLYQQYKTQSGAAPAKQPVLPPKSFGEKALDFATGIAEKIPGVKTLGNVFGTEAAAIAHPKQANQILSTMPTPEQTIGAGIQAAAIPASIAAAPATIPGAIASGAGFGAATGAGAAMEKGAGVVDVAKAGAIGAGVGGATAGAVGLIGKGLQAAGDKILSSVIKPTSSDIKDGFSMSTVKKYDLGGSLSKMYDKTESTLSDLSQQLRDKLASSDASINLNDVYENTVADLSGGKLRSFGSNTSLERAMQQLKGEIDSIAGEGGNISIPDAQVVKQATGRYGAWQYGIPDPESTARQTVYNEFYRNLKTSIEKNSPEGVKEINQQMSKLIPVMNAIVRRIPVAERNNALSLQDMITATASILDPRALVGFGMSLAQKSGTVGNILGKVGGALPKAAPALGEALSSGVSSLPSLPASSSGQTQSSSGSQ